MCGWLLASQGQFQGWGRRLPGLLQCDELCLRAAVVHSPLAAVAYSSLLTACPSTARMGPQLMISDIR